MDTATFIIEGPVRVQITLTELLDGSIRFDIEVLETDGQIGDLNALYFDLNDDSQTDGLYATGTDVSGTAFKVDGVTKIDSHTNMNGEVVNELGKFDAGIQLGTSGIAEDDIQSTSFVLSHETGDLTLSEFSLQDFGARLTSVGTIDGSREDSLKIGDTAPDLTPLVANDDTLTVYENETFNPLGFVDTLDFGETSLLANDTFGGAPYNGLVTSETVGQIVEGTNGGQIVIFEDGTFDFSTGGTAFDNDFSDLNENESRETTFSYQIGDDEIGLLTVIVNGLSTTLVDPSDPPGPSDPLDPTDPTGPNDPLDPFDPFDPFDPTNPGEVF